MFMSFVQQAWSAIVTGVSAIVHHVVLRPIGYVVRKVRQLAGLVMAGVSTAAVAVAHAVIAHIPLSWLIWVTNWLRMVRKAAVLTAIVLGLGWLWTYSQMLLLLAITVGLVVAVWFYWRRHSTPAPVPTPTSKPKAPQGNHRQAVFATH